MKAKIISKNKSTRKSKHLLELPNNILFRIVDSVGFYHRQKIRASCSRLKSICDGQMLHEFRKALAQSKNNQRFHYQALRAMEILSNVYVKAGFQSVFAGPLISLMKKSYQKKSFHPEQKLLKSFMRNFIRLADQQVPGQKGRLLYSLMVLNILNNFEACSMLIKEEIPDRMLKMDCELKGSWFSMHWMGGRTSQVNSYEKHELPAQLVDILIAENMKKSFKNLYECKQRLYYYGHDTRRARSPKTVFTFIAYGPQSILDILKSPFKTNFNDLPENEFEISIKMETKGKIEFGFQQENLLHLKSEENMSNDYILSYKVDQ